MKYIALAGTSETHRQGSENEVYFWFKLRSISCKLDEWKRMCDGTKWRTCLDAVAELNSRSRDRRLKLHCSCFERWTIDFTQLCLHLSDENYAEFRNNYFHVAAGQQWHVYAKVSRWRHCWIHYFSCLKFCFCLTTVSNIMIILESGVDCDC